MKPCTRLNVYPKGSQIEVYFEEGKFLSKTVIKIKGFREDLSRNSVKLEVSPGI